MFSNPQSVKSSGSMASELPARMIKEQVYILLSL